MSQHRESLCRLKNNNAFGVFILDTNDKIIFYNEEAYKMLGLNNRAIFNQNIHDILSNYKVKTSVENNKDYESNTFRYNDKDIWVTETTIRDTNSVHMNCLILQQLDSDGNFDCRLKNEIAEVSLLKTVMETTNDAIVYVNKDGNIELISKAYTEFLGTSIEEATGKHVTEVIENTRMHHVLKTGKPEFEQVQEIRGKKMIATRIPVFVDGQVVGAVGKVLFKNIDELNSLYKKINKIENELNLYKEEFKKINRAKYNLDSIVSVSKAMNDLKSIAIKAARTNSNVLISGESGTGKELVAHSIHMHSKRQNSFFIKVNCGAIPSELLESELFGYEEGSFTGAKKGGKIGKFKYADGGTIFLDEIGELPINMQAKLLRVLQDKEIERIGSNHSEKIDIRVIAATNRDLEKMVQQGKFRLDLYYRLNVININIPPLRERKEDIPSLSRYLVNKISQRENIRVDDIHDSTIEYLKKYDWPGNVRELENILERAINFLDKETIIKPEHLPKKITGVMPNREVKSLKSTLEELEKQTIIDGLIIANGNKTIAANMLEISRTSLYEKMAKYKIDI